MASCATTQNTSSDDYDEDTRTQQVGNRLYVQDPFYGTVVLERDPFTGRYYDVSYGSRYGTSYYGTYPYRGYRSSYYQNYGTQRGNVQQAPAGGQVQGNREEARKKILGN